MVVVLLVSSCRGLGGADLLQLALQAGTPVGNLHQAACLRTERLSTSVREFLNPNGRTDACFLLIDDLSLI